MLVRSSKGSLLRPWRGVGWPLVGYCHLFYLKRCSSRWMTTTCHRELRLCLLGLPVQIVSGLETLKTYRNRRINMSEVLLWIVGRKSSYSLLLLSHVQFFSTIIHCNLQRFSVWHHVLIAKEMYFMTSRWVVLRGCLLSLGGIGHKEAKR